MSEVGVPWETDSEMSVQAYGGALGIPPGGTGRNKMRQREGLTPDVPLYPGEVEA